MKPVFINSSPNTETDDVILALTQLFVPLSWNFTKNVEDIERMISEMYSTNAIAFDSARTSFYGILKALEIGPGDEVIVPAFSCTVIVNPILWVGARPVYVDLEKNGFNTTLDKIKEKVTDKTKLILAQHTFGKALEIDKLADFAKQKDIKLVEDCAHVLGLKYKGKYLGTFGDAAVITFGMTKVISSVRGGMVITNDKFITNGVRAYRETIPNFPFFKTLIFLLNPLIWHLIPPIYYLGIGKFTLGRILVQVLQTLKIISVNNIVEKVEEKGAKPEWIPRKMSGALARLAVHQLKKLNKLNGHRKKVARIYCQELGLEFDQDNLYLRFPLLVENKKEVFRLFKKKKIILGDWYRSILHIPEANYYALKYTAGECPTTEFVVQHIVNLPTSIKVTEKHARFIAKTIKPFLLKNASN